MADILAYTISEAVKVASVSRSELYRAAQRGELNFRKRGKRSLILAEELRRWLAMLPMAKSKTPTRPHEPQTEQQT